MADTKRGRLGVATLTAATNTSVYAVTDSMDAMVDIIVTNTGYGDTTVNLYIVDGAVGDTAGEDVIRYKLAVAQNATEVIEGVRLNASEAVIAYAAGSGVIVRVEGVEEDEAGSSVLPSVQKITETLAFADFVDGEAAVGTATMSTQMPAGAVPLGWKATVTAAFSGDTSCTVQVGVSGDLDRFSSVTDQSIFATGTVGAGVPADACDGIAAAQNILVTATAGSDWGSVSSSASLSMEVYYIRTA